MLDNIKKINEIKIIDSNKIVLFVEVTNLFEFIRDNFHYINLENLKDKNTLDILYTNLNKIKDLESSNKIIKIFKLLKDNNYNIKLTDIVNLNDVYDLNEFLRNLYVENIFLFYDLAKNENILNKIVFEVTQRTIEDEIAKELTHRFYDNVIDKTELIEVLNTLNKYIDYKDLLLKVLKMILKDILYCYTHDYTIQKWLYDYRDYSSLYITKFVIYAHFIITNNMLDNETESIINKFVNYLKQHDTEIENAIKKRIKYKTEITKKEILALIYLLNKNKYLKKFLL